MKSPLDVLVVDDEASSRSGLRRAVVELGHHCRTAEDGEDAWRQHLAQPADVILSDWTMPRVDGFELCKRTRARSDADGPYTYFILVTAHADHEHRIAGMEAGADDFLAKPVDYGDLEARLLAASRVTQLHRRLAAQSRALRKDSQSSFRLARIDPLTGVGNRLKLDEDLSELTRARDAGCVAMCDVDHFKRYNDTFGHAAGDDILRRIALAIGGAVRRDDAVYRYGGEEFALVLPGEPLAHAMPALERVREAVSHLGIERRRRTDPPRPGRPDVVTISIGVAPYVPPTAPATALQRADEALYRAKSAGRNRVVVSVLAEAV